MIRVFVQCAEVTLTKEAEARAPGGAVTVALCGSWDHAGPCRWPHETSVTWERLRGEVRVVFAAPEEEETHVRALIDCALASGRCIGPDGKEHVWTTASHHAGSLEKRELAWAAQMGIASEPGVQRPFNAASDGPDRPTPSAPPIGGTREGQR